MVGKWGAIVETWGKIDSIFKSSGSSHEDLKQQTLFNRSNEQLYTINNVELEK